MSEAELMTTDGGGAVAMPTGEAPLLQMAIEKGASIDTIERLVALFERDQAAKAKTEFFDALAAFQRGCPIIDRKTKGHNNQYAKLEDIVQAVREHMADAGLSHRFEHNSEGGQISVTCVITHISGHSERTSMSAPADTSGNKNPIQALGSSVTYLQRYTLCGALGIVIGGEDNDGGAPVEPASQADLATVRELIEESGADEGKMLAYLGIDALGDLPANRVSEVCGTLKKKMKGKT